MGRPAARVQVRGAKELRRAMRTAGEDMRDWTAIHKAAASPVGRAAVEMAPRLTGALAGSHKTRATRTSARVQAGSATVPYAGPIHFGWPARSIDAQPWLWAAAEIQHESVVAVYEGAVEALVRKIDRMTPD